MNRKQTSTVGLLSGAVGMLIFSLTLPMTHLAMRSFSALGVGLGRSVIAGVLALCTLRLRRVPVPSRRAALRLVGVGAGIVFGFPLLTALALREAHASDLAAVIAGLPMTTAVLGVVFNKEKPSLLFWGASSLGFIAVVLFAVNKGAALPMRPMLYTMGAVLACAYGYAEGAALARTMGGLNVICWALALSLPELALILAFSGLSLRTAPIVPEAVIGLAWVSVGSMFLGFVAWYHGLATAGVSRASQLQLVQPLMTQFWSALLLHEQIDRSAWLTALFVAACMAVCLRVRSPLATAQPNSEQ
jgi:drug/metabolite transporter (DMT)-like permease